MTDFIRQLAVRCGSTRDSSRHSAIRLTYRQFLSTSRWKKNNPIISRRLARRFSARLMQRWRWPSRRRLQRLFVAARLSIRLTHGQLGAKRRPARPLLSSGRALGRRPRPSSRLWSPESSFRSCCVSGPIDFLGEVSGGVWGSEGGWWRRAGLSGWRAAGWRSSKAILSARIIVISVVASFLSSSTAAREPSPPACSEPLILPSSHPHPTFIRRRAAAAAADENGDGARRARARLHFSRRLRVWRDHGAAKPVDQSGPLRSGLLF